MPLLPPLGSGTVTLHIDQISLFYFNNPFAEAYFCNFEMGMKFRVYLAC